MENLNTAPESKWKIRFHDCDPFGHLNNSRYIDYIMTARGDQLIEHYGLNIYQLAQEQKLGWVAAQTQIAYLAPAFVMEEVLVQTRLVAFTTKSLHMEGMVWNTSKSVLKTVMWVNLVHFDLRTQRSHEHSEALMYLFSRIVNPLTAACSFEEYTRSLKASR